MLMKFKKSTNNAAIIKDIKYLAGSWCHEWGEDSESAGGKMVVPTLTYNVGWT